MDRLFGFGSSICGVFAVAALASMSGALISMIVFDDLSLAKVFMQVAACLIPVLVIGAAAMIVSMVRSQ